MFGLFVTICTLVMGGLLVQRAADAAATAAKGRVGAQATLQWDMDKAFANGGFGGTLPDNARLSTTAADKIGTSDLVRGYNYTLENASASDLKPASTIPPPSGLPADMRDDRVLPLHGVRDTEQLRDFRDGQFTIVEGRGLTGADKDRDVVVVEERLAQANRLKVGGKVKLGTAGGGNLREFEVVGVYRNPAQSPKQWASPQSDPGNLMYVPLDALGRLNPEEKLDGGMRINEAVYTLKDPAQLDALRKQATAAGLDMNVFGLTVNDKQYQQLIGPIQNVASFARVTVGLVGVAGAAIVSLLIALWLRERRRELGVLLAMGERRWRLVAQQITEVLAIATVALAGATALGGLLAQPVTDALLGRQLADVPPPTVPIPGRAGVDLEPALAPIDKLDVLLGVGDIVSVGLIGLLIALIAVAVPAFRIVGLQPREILTKGE
ncbi:putative ABC transport system permease protein [Allocatelliglobosispora scoriae]|uniref:Putative ABC transport system permease protein n=1 Tax=Allocatelliglobosispora scoriae TaxID=643052 RepID=A0A841BU70_9ACTN|nr:ABC transporter permease [Allocatelliglobosispora scoriae]MBB5870320.1 putative ABC transport system permease protein [Allocatelliglobosispora scoriae]